MTGSSSGRSLRWPLVGAIFVVYAAFLQTNLPTPLYRTWQQEIGFRDSTLSWIYAAYIIAVVVVLLLVWRIGPRLRPRPTLLVAVIAGLASSAVFVMAGSVAELVAARALCGVMAGLMTTVGVTAALSTTPPHRAHRTAAATSLAIAAAFATGPLSSGLVAQVAEVPVAAVYACGSAVLGFALLILLADPYDSRRRPATAVVPLTAPSDAALHLRRPLLSAMLAYAPGTAATATLLAFAPQIFGDRVTADSPLTVGLLAFGMGGTGVTAHLLVSHWQGRSTLVTGSAVLSAGVAALTASVHVDAIGLVVLAVALIGAGQVLTQSGAFAVLASSVTVSHRAVAFSQLTMVGYGAAAVGPLLTGYVSDSHGMETSIAILAGAILLVSVMAIHQAAAGRVSTAPSATAGIRPGSEV